MRLLLDTHVLIWALSSPATLSAAARRLVADGRNDIFFSSISVFELASKRASGRRGAPELSAESVALLASSSGFRELAVLSAHAAAVETLAISHPDPFDRLLLAQAQVEDMRLVTHDESLAAYDPRTILA